MQEFQSTFSKQSHIPQLLCNNNNKAMMLCCSQSCENCALICRVQSCTCLPKQHLQCQFIYAENIINKITQKKSSIPEQIEKAVKAIDDIYIEAIEKLSEDRQSLQKWKENYGLTGFEVQFIQNFKSNDRNKITGKLVANIKKNLNQAQDTNWLTIEWVQDFWQKQKNSFNRMFSKINHFSRSFSSSLKNICNAHIQSKIISKDQIDQLISFFDKPIKQFKLLYRATQNNNSIQQFHKKCDQIQDTVTLIQTSADKIIGGYTPLKWKSTTVDQPEQDSSGQSFIFSITLDEKYPLVQKKYAIYNKSTLGPRFGNGRDICIRSQSLGHYFQFPTSYNNGKYKKSQATYLAFNGSRTSNTGAKQWEVFKVIFDK